MFKKTIICFILFLLPFSAYPQPRAIIHQVDISRFPVMRAYVSVLDSQGETIKGLDRTFFSLNEDGVEIDGIQCSSIFPNQEWLAVVIAIDKSGSMKGTPIEEAKNGARKFIQKAGLQDRISLMFFDDEIFWKTNFTREKELLQKEIESVIPQNNTSLYDALTQSLDRLKNIDSPRKAAVILTDGKDTRSQISQKECLNKVMQSKIPVYMIGLGKEVNREIIKRISKQSRGNFFFTSDSSQLQQIYSSISSQLENQYILTYPFHGKDDIATHELIVRVSLPNRVIHDKIYYSLESYTVSGSKTSSKRFMKPQSLYLFMMLGALIGLIISLIISRVLFRDIQISITIKILFIVLGVLLFAVIGMVIAYFI